jgi:hypothetical protein
MIPKKNAVATLCRLGNNDKKKGLYMFDTDIIIFSDVTRDGVYFFLWLKSISLRACTTFSLSINLLMGT